MGVVFPYRNEHETRLALDIKGKFLESNNNPVDKKFDIIFGPCSATEQYLHAHDTNLTELLAWMLLYLYRQYLLWRTVLLYHSFSTSHTRNKKTYAEGEGLVEFGQSFRW